MCINVFREVNISCLLLHNLDLIVVKHYQQHYMTIPFIFPLSAARLSKLFYPRKFQSSVHLGLLNCKRLQRVFLIPLRISSILFVELGWFRVTVIVQS